MSCPTCNHLNPTTAARCLNCGSVLIHEAAGHSDQYKRAAASIDSKIHAGIGGFFGFMLSGVVLKFSAADYWLNDRQMALCAMVGGVVGAILGRMILKIKNQP